MTSRIRRYRIPCRPTFVYAGGCRREALRSDPPVGPETRHSQGALPCDRKTESAGRSARSLFSIASAHHSCRKSPASDMKFASGSKVVLSKLQAVSQSHLREEVALGI